MTADEEIDAFLAEMKVRVKGLVDLGRIEGRNVMLTNIIKAAQSPEAMTVQIGPMAGTGIGSAISSPTPKRRAPKGLVPDTIRKALMQAPGSTVPEIIELAREIEPRVAAASIGNDLRRMLGKLYEQDGRRWYLMGQKQSAGESITTAPADQYNF